MLSSYKSQKRTDVSALSAKPTKASNFPIDLNPSVLASDEADVEVLGEGAAKVGCAMLCVFGWVVVLLVFLSAVPLIENWALWAKIVPAELMMLTW